MPRYLDTGRMRRVTLLTFFYLRVNFCLACPFQKKEYKLNLTTALILLALICLHIKFYFLRIFNIYSWGQKTNYKSLIVLPGHVKLEVHLHMKQRH